jgi:hypothetical protein
MKKLFALVALIGMGSFIGGCEKATKPPTDPTKMPSSAMDMQEAADMAKEKEKEMEKSEGDKGDMSADETKPGEGATTAGEEKPDGDGDGDAKPDRDEKSETEEKLSESS